MGQKVFTSGIRIEGQIEEDSEDSVVTEASVKNLSKVKGLLGSI